MKQFMFEVNNYKNARNHHLARLGVEGLVDKQIDVVDLDDTNNEIDQKMVVHELLMPNACCH